MICYEKLFNLMKQRGRNTTHIREEKIVSQDTLGKLRRGTGIYDIGKDPNNLDENGKATKKMRINSVDTKSIESLCTWLNCQPSDIMEVIPNTWENADRLCEILSTKDSKCTREELPKRVPMEKEAEKEAN